MSSTGIDKVLILNETKSGNKTLEKLIIQGLKHPHAICEALIDDKGIRLVRQGDYGLLILVTDIKNETALKACTLASHHPTATIILIAEPYEENDKAALTARDEFLEIGATILNKPLTKNSFLVAINSADMAHIRLCTLHKKIEEEKVISRSKLILVKTLSLTEDEAHKYIEKEAMNTGQTRLEAAYEIISTYDYL